MSIRTLQIFQTVCTEGGITKAAQKLYMTQPAVSHAIKELETERGFPLFDRISRKLFLTDAGRALLEKTNTLLELYGEIEAMDENLFYDATIHIGSCITAAGYWLPRIIKDFRQSHAGVKLSVKVEAAEGIIELLKSNSVDMAILEGPYVLEQYELVPFSSYGIIAVCSPSHPFADAEAVGLFELMAEPLLLREKGSAIRDPFDSCVLLHGLVADPAVTSVNSQALIQLAKESAGIAILADKVVERELSSGELHRVSLPEMDIRNDISVAYHKNKYVPQPMAELISLILFSSSL